jgi:tripartite-type tricarboxylate transporter receptor subunit TctC
MPLEDQRERLPRSRDKGRAACLRRRSSNANRLCWRVSAEPTEFIIDVSNRWPAPDPSKPVTIISDSGAGSTPDALLRVIADRLSQIWGQQILAVNHPGATGSIASRIAADAAPDGYTLYMPVLSSFVQLPGAALNVPMRLPRDFTAIGFAGENPMFIVVNPSLGVTKLSALIARAKARPGEIACAVTGVGRLTHLTAELLQSRADIKLLTVPYTGGPAHAISDVVSGRVGLIIEGYSGIAGAVQSGSVKAIAVASEEPLTSAAKKTASARCCARPPMDEAMVCRDCLVSLPRTGVVRIL